MPCQQETHISASVLERQKSSTLARCLIPVSLYPSLVFRLISMPISFFFYLPLCGKREWNREIRKRKAWETLHWVWWVSAFSRRAAVLQKEPIETQRAGIAADVLMSCSHSVKELLVWRVRDEARAKYCCVCVRVSVFHRCAVMYVKLVIAANILCIHVPCVMYLCGCVTSTV